MQEDIETFFSDLEDKINKLLEEITLMQFLKSKEWLLPESASIASTMRLESKPGKVMYH